MALPIFIRCLAEIVVAQYLNKVATHRYSSSMIVSMLDCVLLPDVISTMFHR